MRSEALFDAAGSLRDAYAAVDWAATPLGPVHTWGFALRNAVDLLLHSRFPIALFWAPEFVLVYNEAYVELIGEKHPSALGSPARVVFPEAWDTIGPKMQGVLAGGDPFFAVDEPVPLERHGMLEECYFTFSYSAAGYLDDLVEGVIDIATETTQQVLDRRRLELLAALREELGGVDGPEDIARTAPAVLATNRHHPPAAQPRPPAGRRAAPGRRGHRRARPAAARRARRGARRCRRRRAGDAGRPRGMAAAGSRAGGGGRRRPARGAAQRAARARRQLLRVPDTDRLVAGSGAGPRDGARRRARHRRGGAQPVRDAAAQPAHRAAADRDGAPGGALPGGRPR